jgi:uncharacterized protein (DUF2141 family)
MKFNSVLLLFFSFLLASCARVGSPTGGPKDIIPPKIVKSTPPNLSTDFKAKGFNVTFNEYVDLKDINNQLLISPPMIKAPVIQIKKRSVVATFQEPLRDNTTYSFNFGNAIVDITEGNIYGNFQYVFSTGNHIDSLKVNGKIQIEKSNSFDKGILVMLYADSIWNDSTPIKKRPSYFSKTDAKGNFTISYVAPGKYHIFALKDANNNYLFDSPSEIVAFTDNIIDPSKNDSTLTLHLFEESYGKQHLLRAQNVQYGKFLFAFSQPATNVKITDLKGNPFGMSNLPNSKKPWEFKEFSSHLDTISYWINDLSKDSLHLIITDSINFRDTVNIGILKKFQKKAAEKKTFTINANVKNRDIFDFFLNLNLKFPNPIKEYDQAKVVLKEDSTIITQYKVIFEDKAMRNFGINYKWKEDGTYHLFIPKGVFADIYGNVNDTLKIDFKIKNAGSYGNMTLKLKAPSATSNYIIQLVDERDNIIKQDIVKGDAKIEYPNLYPQKYRLKAIFDDNGNEKWDTGNYLKKIQPEKIIYYKEILGIRANWDLDIDWNLAQ